MILKNVVNLLRFLSGYNLTPKKESSYNVSPEGQKGGINGQKKFHSGTDHSQAEGS